MFYLSISIYLRYFSINRLLFCAFLMLLTLVKLEGHVAFGLSVSVWVWVLGGCLVVGLYASGVVYRDVAGWLGLLVTFLKL